MKHNRILNEDQKSELDKRYADYKNDIGKNYSWVEVTKISDKILSEQQIKLLKLSDDDIKSGRLIPHYEVYKNTLAWLKEA